MHHICNERHKQMPGCLIEHGLTCPPTQYHRLRGSANPVLTATHHSYGILAWLSDFFPAHPWRSDP